MLPKLLSFGKIDIQLLPINGRDGSRYRRNCIGNMTYQEAADLAGEVGPGLVIPGHFDMFADNSEDPNAFADYIDAKYHDRLKCRIPKVMEKIEYR
jgi:L-ascorbate metabolism protein UlaG (beta-lactamase superfamily)